MVHAWASRDQRIPLSSSHRSSSFNRSSFCFKETASTEDASVHELDDLGPDLDNTSSGSTDQLGEGEVWSIAVVCNVLLRCVSWYQLLLLYSICPVVCAIVLPAVHNRTLQCRPLTHVLSTCVHVFGMHVILCCLISVECTPIRTLASAPCVPHSGDCARHRPMRVPAQPDAVPSHHHITHVCDAADAVTVALLAQEVRG